MELVASYRMEIEILGQLLLAMILGAVIGFERELADKPAGLRTHMIVASSAALLVGIADKLAGQYAWQLGEQVIRTDPIRVVEAIITGISFLGAGTIIRRRTGRDNKVEGLTTAAALLFSAGIGICVALSLWALSIGATLLVLIALRGLRVFEGRFD